MCGSAAPTMSHLSGARKSGLGWLVRKEESSRFGAGRGGGLKEVRETGEVQSKLFVWGGIWNFDWLCSGLSFRRAVSCGANFCKQVH